MVIKRLRVGKSQRAARNMIDLIPNFVMHADGSLFHLHECTQHFNSEMLAAHKSQGRDVRTHPTKPDRRIAFRVQYNGALLALQEQPSKNPRSDAGCSHSFCAKAR